MSLFDKIISEKGLESCSRNSKVGRLMRHRGVVRTKDFERIYNLPRRNRYKFFQEHQLGELMTNWLKTENGTMKLWPEQAVALHDLYEVGGLFAPIAVGRGKALTSFLAGTVIDAQRPLILLPAQLRAVTIQKRIPEMRRHWRLPKKIEVRGYSEISLAKNHDLLFEINPDLIILDEAHYLKNRRSARTRKFIRFLKQNPQVSIAALSGTMTNKSLRDYWQLMLWCLDDKAPLPLKWRELQDWADALDSDVDDSVRVAPGAIFHFCNEGENAREGFRRRMVESFGVVSSGKTQLGVSLNINLQKFKIPSSVRTALIRLYNDWETPNGDFLTQAIELWRYAQQVSLGFWYRWDPPAPKEWLEARRVWKKFVRETIKNNKQGLDSELQVWNNCKKTKLSKDHPWLRYAKIKNDFKINTVIEWVDKYAIEMCSEWLYKRTCNEPGICWVEHVEFGKELSKFSSMNYFGAGNNKIEECDHSGVIASIAANSEGKNLQRYNYNLITCPPSSGKVWEQLLGRTHREKQKADTVYVDVFYSTDAQQKAFEKAQTNAIYLQDTMGVQKLMYANIIKCY